MSNTNTPETENPEIDLKILRASTQDAIAAATELRILIRNHYRWGAMAAEEYCEAVKMLSVIDAHVDKTAHDTGLWFARLVAEKANRSKAAKGEQRVLDVIERADKAVSPVELAVATGMSSNSVRTYLGRMVEKQLIVKEGRGLYRLPSADDSD